MCEKLSFDTYAEAQHIVNIAHNQNKRTMYGKRRINRRQKQKPRRVYKCETCGKYHLTSKLKR
jgi:hypothetical protein